MAATRVFSDPSLLSTIFAFDNTYKHAFNQVLKQINGSVHQRHSLFRVLIGPHVAINEQTAFIVEEYRVIHPNGVAFVCRDHCLFEQYTPRRPRTEEASPRWAHEDENEPQDRALRPQNQTTLRKRQRLAVWCAPPYHEVKKKCPLSPTKRQLVLQENRSAKCQCGKTSLPRERRAGKQARDSVQDRRKLKRRKLIQQLLLQKLLYRHFSNRDCTARARGVRRLSFTRG